MVKASNLGSNIATASKLRDDKQLVIFNEGVKVPAVTTIRMARLQMPRVRRRVVCSAVRYMLYAMSC